MQVDVVTTQADLQAFIELPYQHYHRDPMWVPPLRSEQLGQFDPGRNPMLQHCTYRLFLLREGGKVIGRVSAFTDSLALEHWKEPIGLFGSYECVQDEAASRLLLGAARDWLKEQGMRWMRGPWSFASQEWGTVVEGFTPPPVVMAPYNPPYYGGQLTAFGLEKVKDLLVYYIDSREGYQFPERFLKFTDKIAERYGVRVRAVNMARLEEDVSLIVKLANQSIADNWGYYPVTEAEGRAMARDMKQIVQPRGLLIAEDAKGNACGFAMTLPDVNTLLRGLNGRLLPFGWLKLLWGIPRIHQYRMWALGVTPEYQGKGIDTLLYRKTYEALYTPATRLEINYVLEDNVRMNNALTRLEVKPLRRYRVYQMSIAS
jgi:ribosomal protein S18 acetylase RimI-like enzyme